MDIMINGSFIQSSLWKGLSFPARCIYMAIISEYDGSPVHMDYADIADLVGTSVPTVARHIGSLTDARIIRSRARGYYLPIFNLPTMQILVVL